MDRCSRHTDHTDGHRHMDRCSRHTDHTDGYRVRLVVLCPALSSTCQYHGMQLRRVRAGYPPRFCSSMRLGAVCEALWRQMNKLTDVDRWWLLCVCWEFKRIWVISQHWEPKDRPWQIYQLIGAQTGWTTMQWCRLTCNSRTHNWCQILYQLE